MRLIHFLNEKEYTHSKIIDILKKNCSKYILHSADTTLFRGIDSVDAFVIHKQIKTRKPLDSSISFHKIIDKAFFEVFGKKLRSQSFFCTHKKSIANMYGNTYICFPSDDYTVYWSSIISDLANISAWFDTVISKYKSNNDILAFCLLHIILNYKKVYSWSNRENFIDMFKAVNYFKKLNLPHDFEDISMSYTDLPEDWALEIAKDIMKAYPTCMTTFVKKLYKKDKIKNTLNTNNELMIVCSKMYYVQGKVYDEIYNEIK